MERFKVNYRWLVPGETLLVEVMALECLTGETLRITVPPNVSSDVLAAQIKSAIDESKARIETKLIKQHAQALLDIAAHRIKEH